MLFFSNNRQTFLHLEVPKKINILQFLTCSRYGKLAHLDQTGGCLQSDGELGNKCVAINEPVHIPACL